MFVIHWDQGIFKNIWPEKKKKNIRTLFIQMRFESKLKSIYWNVNSYWVNEKFVPRRIQISEILQYDQKIFVYFDTFFSVSYILQLR